MNEAEELDVPESETAQSIAQTLKSATFLGQEFLTWALWRSATNAPLGQLEDQPITLRFLGPIRLQGFASDATDLIAQGHGAPYASVVRYSLAQGLLVHTARLRFQIGGQAYEATVDAEHLDIRSAELPKVLSTEDDDAREERLWLCEKLNALLDAVWGNFIDLRIAPSWAKEEATRMRAWMYHDLDLSASDTP